MSTHLSAGVVNAVPNTLPLVRVRGIAFQLLLVAAAVLLPAAGHWLDLPVRWLLPMHWAVILAGLAYGPLGGAAVGLLAPPVSVALSGMPPIGSLPIMMTELFAYGVLTGLLRGPLRCSAYGSVAVALLAGRLLAIAVTLLAGVPVAAVAIAYAKGLPAAVAQVALLPAVAGWWIRRERRGTGHNTTREPRR